MASRRGFTIAEVMVVTAIIIVLAAITYPAYVQAKKKTAEVTCLANMRQIHLILTSYRADWGGDVTYGKPSEMGLPPSKKPISQQINRLQACKGLDWALCRPYGGEGIDFLPLWPVNPWDPVEPEREAAWAALTQRWQDSTVVGMDANHQFTCPLTEFSTGRAIGLKLDGSVHIRLRHGDPTSTPNWWYED